MTNHISFLEKLNPPQAFVVNVAADGAKGIGKSSPQELKHFMAKHTGGPEHEHLHSNLAE